MTTLARTIVQELQTEARTTRRVLERVPGDRLQWKPHPTARSLGELAMHIAIVPGAVAEFSSSSPVQVPDFTDPVLQKADELLPMLDTSVEKASRIVGAMDDATLAADWHLMRGDQTVMKIPRVALLRSVMLNHWYHHRGQLSVYLRELGVPVPSIYGPSADENPFA
jgi:uncharacterized damage-inducible protein DinB